MEIEIEIEIELKFLQRAMRLTTSRRSSLSVFSVILVFVFLAFFDLVSSVTAAARRRCCTDRLRPVP